MKKKKKIQRVYTRSWEAVVLPRKMLLFVFNDWAAYLFSETKLKSTLRFCEVLIVVAGRTFTRL